MLECEWVSPNDRDIYSLKWYFGLEEFYRWTPAEANPVQVFSVDAFDVSVSESSRGTVRIRNLSRKATGVMRCEISEEAPSFHTDAKTARLEMVDLPDSPPMLSPLQPVYELHQMVQLNCTSLNSSPPASLAFFINNEPVNPAWVSHNDSFRSRFVDGQPLYTSTRQLRFRLLPRLMGNDGRVLVKCTAEISGVYWETHEVELPIDQPQRASIMEGRSSAGECCA
ncbi:Immunoglobulin-like domain [Trinorchestia longiramus]|nr:Immunoglobulin-like domain [Trinorchestia longiramus]